MGRLGKENKLEMITPQHRGRGRVRILRGNTEGGYHLALYVDSGQPPSEPRFHHKSYMFRHKIGGFSASAPLRRSKEPVYSQEPRGGSVYDHVWILLVLKHHSESIKV
ncbi:hypothetical protein J6590_048307 [Homalodisca vitripennis]|nr:hypothetical protein J6590_048307 [Homalodisca vitripennis]